RLPAGAVVLFREPTLWGRYRWYLVAAAALLFLETVLIFGLLMEMRRRQAAEQQLQKEQRLSHAVMQTLPGVFAVFNQNGRMLQWNKNLEDMAGYSSSEISALNVLDLIAVPDRQKIKEAIARVFTNGASQAEG